MVNVMFNMSSFFKKSKKNQAKIKKYQTKINKEYLYYVIGRLPSFTEYTEKTLPEIFKYNDPETIGEFMNTLDRFYDRYSFVLSSPKFKKFLGEDQALLEDALKMFYKSFMFKIRTYTKYIFNTKPLPYDYEKELIELMEVQKELLSFVLSIINSPSFYKLKKQIKLKETLHTDIKSLHFALKRYMISITRCEIDKNQKNR